MTAYRKRRNATEFTGARNDITMFGEFIRDYLDKYKRWESPKYLFGESYGTFRSAGLASELQSNEGVELNGTAPRHRARLPVHLAVTRKRHRLLDLPADVHGHRVVPQETPGRPPAHEPRAGRAAVARIMFGDYMTALAKGNSLTAAERTAVAQKLARFTGVSEQFILNTNLRIDAGTYRTELLRGERETVGRYDSRIIGLNGNASATREDYDPSDAAPTGAFMSSFMRYLQNDLNYTSDLQYYLGGHTGRWDYSNFGNSYASETDELRTAMAKNPQFARDTGATTWRRHSRMRNTPSGKSSASTRPTMIAVKFELYYQSAHGVPTRAGEAAEGEYCGIYYWTEHETKSRPEKAMGDGTAMTDVACGFRRPRIRQGPPLRTLSLCATSRALMVSATSRAISSCVANTSATFRSYISDHDVTLWSALTRRNVTRTRFPERWIDPSCRTGVVPGACCAAESSGAAL